MHRAFAAKASSFETRALVMSDVAVPDGSHAFLAYINSSSIGVVEFTRGGGTQLLAQRSIKVGPIQGDASEATTYGDDGSCEAVKVAPNGSAVAVWSVRVKDSCNSQVSVAYRPAGGSWSTPQAVGPASKNPHCIRAAIAPSGAASVIWSDGGDNLPASITAATTTDGSSWKVSNPVSTPEWVTEPALAFDASGTHVFFGGSTRFNDVVLAEANLDGSAAAAYHLDSKAASQGETNQIGLAPEPDGAMLVSWYRYGTNGINMMVSDARITGSAISATAPVSVGTTPDLTSRASSLSLQSYAAINSAGTPYVVWHSLGSRKVRVAAKVGGSWTSRGTKLPATPLPLAVHGLAAPAGAYSAFNDAFRWFGVSPQKPRRTYTNRTGFISFPASGSASVHTVSKFVIRQHPYLTGRVMTPYERSVGIAATGNDVVLVTERTLFKTETTSRRLTKKQRVMRLLTAHFTGP